MIFWGLVYLHASSKIKTLGPIDYVIGDACINPFNETHCYVNIVLPSSLSNPKIYIDLDNFYNTH